MFATQAWVGHPKLFVIDNRYTASNAHTNRIACIARQGCSLCHRSASQCSAASFSCSALRPLPIDFRLTCSHCGAARRGAARRGVAWRGVNGFAAGPPSSRRCSEPSAVLPRSSGCRRLHRSAQTAAGYATSSACRRWLKPTSRSALHWAQRKSIGLANTAALRSRNHDHTCHCIVLTEDQPCAAASLCAKQ